MHDPLTLTLQLWGLSSSLHTQVCWRPLWGAYKLSLLQVVWRRPRLLLPHQVVCSRPTTLTHTGLPSNPAPWAPSMSLSQLLVSGPSPAVREEELAHTVSWFSAKHPEHFLSYRSCNVSSSDWEDQPTRCPLCSPEETSLKMSTIGAWGPSNSWIKGTVEGNMLSQRAPGMLQTWMEFVWTRWVLEMPMAAKGHVEQLWHTVCSEGSALSQGPNLECCVHRQFTKDLSRIQCCHHKSQDWFWFAKQLILSSGTFSSIKS